eukprot:1158422-Pelagomonas_calceolata.AAC.3
MAPPLTTWRHYSSSTKAWRHNGAGNSADSMKMTTSRVEEVGPEWSLVKNRVRAAEGHINNVHGHLALTHNNQSSQSGNCSLGQSVMLNIGAHLQPTFQASSRAKNTR